MRFIPALDGLRGLAVILVVLRHAMYIGGYESVPPAALEIFMLNGWIGVDLFFVLSGFLIARPFFSERPFAWRPYLRNRLLRIFPAYFFVLLIAWWIPFYDISNDNIGWRVFYHLMFIQDYLPSDIVIAFWSLGVEEKFYIFAPLVLPLVASQKNIKIQLLLIILLLLGGPLSRLLTIILYGPADNYPDFFKLYRSPFHACMDGLFFGVLLARLELLQIDQSRRERASLCFRYALILISALMLSHELLGYIDENISVLRPIGIGFLMAALVGASIFGGAPRFFESSVPRWLGRISYSLYLIHIPLIGLSNQLTREVGGGFTVFLAVYLAISIAAAQLMHSLIERPFLRIKSRIGRGSTFAVKH